MARELRSGMGARAIAKAANRRAILDAARQVVAEKGYEAASVRDVIRRTELASGTFYNYFRSKEELFAALATDALEQFRPLLISARKSASNSREFVQNAFKAYFDYFVEDHIRHSDIDGDTPARLAASTDLEAIFNEAHHQIKVFFIEARVEGVDSEFAASAALGIAREFRSRLVRRENPDTDAAARIATTFFLCGLAGLTKESASRRV